MKRRITITIVLVILLTIGILIYARYKKNSIKLQFPWNETSKIVALQFSYNSNNNLGDYYYAQNKNDALHILNQPLDSLTLLKIDKPIYLNTEQHSTYINLCWKAQPLFGTTINEDEMNGKDCIFNPHHCIVHLDKNNRVIYYALICYECEDLKCYAIKKSYFLGNPKQLFYLFNNIGITPLLYDPEKH